MLCLADRKGHSISSATQSSQIEQASDTRPLVLITGATGNLGASIAEALGHDYRVVGLDRGTGGVDFPVFKADVTSDASLAHALDQVRAQFGARIASVIHLIAYFDFTGEDNPLYQTVNVEGTRRLLRALRSFEVEQFIYASTMLVHAPCRPGERIDEDQPIAPSWAYPKSKAAAEAAIRAEHGDIPYVILRLAGVYDEHAMPPTLAQQVARIYERDFESYFYSASTLVGQSMLHREDMLDAFVRTVERRKELMPDTAILIGERDAVGYDVLQDEIARIVHGADDWPTLRLPKPVAAAGAWAKGALETVIPDLIDGGEAPFIKPFMVAMSDDHYALDTRRARDMLGWEPRHRLAEALPQIVATLKSDPAAWYAANHVSPPVWLTHADELGRNPDKLRARHEAQIETEHRANRWAHVVNIGLGTWLLTQPPLIGVEERWLAASEAMLGAALIVFAAVALWRRAQLARWVCAAIGVLVMAAPFLFSTANAAAYLSDTLVGALIFGFAVCTKPEPGPSALAALTGPTTPPGWSFNPSTWTQRMPIIALAFIGLYVSRYLAGYQLEHINGVWEPFFTGSAADAQNGTEEIITSAVSRAWPVSDAAVGGYTYMLEILTGIVGSQRRWRTMPWLVVLFGLMIAPLGVVSISFIIIQPLVIGTWSTLALIAAAAVLIQIPYSLDELLASLQFLRRRAKAGRSWICVLFLGDTDEVDPARTAAPDHSGQSASALVKAALSGGVSLPWNLGLAALIGVSLLFTRVTLGADGALANTHHVIGALILTVISIAAAEVARPARFLIIPLATVLMASPFMLGAGLATTTASLIMSAGLTALSLRRGRIYERYGQWNRIIV